MIVKLLATGTAELEEFSDELDDEEEGKIGLFIGPASISISLLLFIGYVRRQVGIVNTIRF